MGVALFAAVDGREQLALPGEAMARTGASEETADTGKPAKGGRIIQTLLPARPTDKRVIEVSTLYRDGDREVVRQRPFAHIKVALAANHSSAVDYPDFDPLAIFSDGDTPDDDGTDAAEATGELYGAEVESEISLRTTDFPADGAGLTYAPAMSVEEAEETVRNNGSVLTDGTVQVAALHYVDPQRFASLGPDLDFSAGLNSRVITENVSLASPKPALSRSIEYAEDVLSATEDSQIVDLMRSAGYDDIQSSMVSGIFANFNSSSMLREGDLLRLGLEQSGDDTRIIRASIYNGGEHRLTVAENDRGFFVRAVEPANADIIVSTLDENALPALSGRDLPTVYDGIYRAALSYGMNVDMTAQIVRLLSGNVDFQDRLRATDRLEAFFSVDEASGEAVEGSELLYVNATFGDTTTRFYRFRNPEDDAVDYYDEEGRSVRQFLLRNPLPNGRFTSSFGMRRHPILGYSRMHAGVDWSAPTGTPIIASGSGVVESAGWHSGGFGRHTVIRHANGYESSYSHQSRIANGVVAGARVSQGQVIGYVGSTGLSTGPHLHYELSVNGSKVDPMRVRLPDAKSLEGETLALFQKERERIDALLDEDGVMEAEVASR